MRIILSQSYLKIAKKKPFKYKGETFDVNPFAVCNESTGGKKEVGKAKFERCVQKVKSKSKK